METYRRLNIWLLQSNRLHITLCGIILVMCIMFQNGCDTHGSLFSWEPNMIIDLRAFQSCRTLSRASWAKRGGSRSWSGMSESQREKRKPLIQHTHEANNVDEIWDEGELTFCISSLSIPVLSDAWRSVLTVLNTLPGDSLHQEQ